jgi:E3 SUMO-protein ligase PIAS1
MDILTNTPQTVEQVTIEPDGKWFVPPAQGDDKNSARHDTSFVDDDDLVIAQVSSRHSTTATPNRSGYAYSTPAQESSREGSSMPRSATSSKRPAAEVIDLTLSDDEDEPPAKRPKNQFSGYPGWPH